MRLGRPYVDLHRHLDGNVRLATMLDVGLKRGVKLPASTLEGLKPHAQVIGATPSLVAFLQKFDLIQAILLDYEVIARIARENVEDAALEGLDYVELRFSPYFMALEHGLDTNTVTQTICTATAAAAKEFGVRVNLIVIMSRTFGIETCMIELNSALKNRDHGVIGIDLAGDEAGKPGKLFVKHFAAAKEANLRITVHAGEAAGPESVEQAVLELGAERIGHGVRSIESERTLSLLKDRDIGLEVCPTSNVQTGTFKSYAEHPLKRLMAKGVRVTINTDDPGISGIDLAHEYDVAQNILGLTSEEIARAQHNGAVMAFLTEAEKRGVFGTDWQSHP